MVTERLYDLQPARRCDARKQLTFWDGIKGGREGGRGERRGVHRKLGCVRVGFGNRIAILFS